MKSNLLKQTLAWVLAFAYIGQITAGAANETQGDLMIQKWNTISMSWPKNHSERQIDSYLRTLGVKYNPRFEQKDAAYLKLQLAQFSELPVMEKTDKGIVFTLKSNKNLRAEFINLGDKGFSLNGKVFKMNTQMTLEQMHSVLGELLKEKTNVSFFESLFVPQAQAEISGMQWLLIIGVLGLTVGGILLYNNKKKNEEQYNYGKSLEDKGSQIKWDALLDRNSDHSHHSHHDEHED
jgi:hypothetical protein